MSISRFQQASGSRDLSTFFAWLNAHKGGTFLENLTLTNTTSRSSNDTVNFIDTDSSAFIRANQGSGYDVIYYTSGSFSMTSNTASSSSSYAYLVGALLCTKGLIVQFYAYDGSSNFDYYAFCITVDNNGKLAAIKGGHINTNQITTWYTAATGSTANAQRNCRPNFQANQTSLAPITAQGIDTNLYLPYAYAAISTQLNQEGLYIVAINGDPYITNSVWYIKDGD